MVKFSEDLWDGFDVLNAKTEQGVQVLKDIVEFLKKRAQIEAEYAKALGALCKAAPGSSGSLFGKNAPAIDKETKTLKAALLSIQEEGSRTATGHQDFANKVLSDIVKPLDASLKAKENDRKKNSIEGQKRLKAVQEAKAAAEKTKDSYLKASKEAEGATEAHEKAKSDLAGAADNKKHQEAEKRAGQKVGPLNEKAKAAEGAYTKAVDTANDVVSKTFSEHLPPVIDAIQTLEEERYALLRTALQDYLTAQRAIPANIEERCQELEKAISAIDIDADLSEFVDAHKSAATAPEKIQFVAFKEPAGQSSTTTTTATPENPAESDVTEKVAVAEEPQKPVKNEEDIF